MNGRVGGGGVGGLDWEAESYIEDGGATSDGIQTHLQ